MDETYVKVKGKWYYLYHAVDKFGNTAVRNFFKKAIKSKEIPEKITIDKKAVPKQKINE